MTSVFVSDSSALSSGVFVRMAARQEEGVLSDLLDALSSPLLAGKTVLCGSAALHGLYLHSRRAPIIDLKATPLLAIRFAKLFQSEEMSLVPTEVRNRYALSSRRIVLPGLQFFLTLHPTQEMPAAIEVPAPGQRSGRHTSARTVPLADAVADKLPVLASRRQAVDYLDASRSVHQSYSVNATAICGRSLIFFLSPLAMSVAFVGCSHRSSI